MSGRGRGKGRGGRGGAGTSQARLLLQKSAAEAGIDERSAISMLQPPHYPDMLWHSSGRYMTPDEEAAFRASETQKKKPHLQYTNRSSNMTFLVRKQRHLADYFQRSPQHIRNVPPHLDIERYEEDNNGEVKLTNPERPDIAVLQALGKLASTAYLPDELLSSGGTTISRPRKGRKRCRNADGSLLNLEEFEKKERKDEKGAADGNSDEEGDDRHDFDIALGDVDDEEEEEDNHDYTTNYYESAGESEDGVDDGEATF